MFLLASLVLFAIFSVNVVLGAFDATPFLGDVGEMLLLFATSLCFAVGVLRREAAEKKKAEKTLES